MEHKPDEKEPSGAASGTGEDKTKGMVGLEMLTEEQRVRFSRRVPPPPETLALPVARYKPQILETINANTVTIIVGTSSTSPPLLSPPQFFSHTHMLFFLNLTDSFECI